MQAPRTQNLAPSVKQFALETRERFEKNHAYCAEDDCLYVYTADVPTIGVTLDDHLTVLLSKRDNSFAGCVIHGVRKLVARLLNRNGVVTVGTVVEQAVVSNPAVFWRVRSEQLESVREEDVDLAGAGCG